MVHTCITLVGAVSVGWVKGALFGYLLSMDRLTSVTCLAPIKAAMLSGDTCVWRYWNGNKVRQHFFILLLLLQLLLLLTAAAAAAAAAD